ncbi:hypothetical protein WME97_21705 [Sorangium sp. So ce367]|uniref:hypothetical protein n=1 Tax=Sorangium sp. So ce367 TaxID=3133305 RepID=UPI003F63DA2D
MSLDDRTAQGARTTLRPLAQRAARHPPGLAWHAEPELARHDLGSHEDGTPQETLPGEGPPWTLSVRGPEARERTIGRLERMGPRAKEYAKD